MSENSKIEWCHHTFNPWIGCTKVGPGCDNCYAEADFDKRRHVVQWGAGQPRKRTAMSTWAMPLRWNAKAERLGVRYRVFCASLADVFDNEVPAEWRADLFELIERTPHLDWLLVTKRIGNVRQMIPDRWSVCMPPNLWLGITVVNQAEADRDIPKLLGLKVSVRFLSMEPLLGAVDLTRYHDWLGRSAGGMWCPDCPERGVGIDPDEHTHCLGEVVDAAPYDGIDWVIVGGESGPKARPMHPQWARDLRDQCAEAGVPFLFKQWGEWVDCDSGPEDDALYEGKADCWAHIDGGHHDGAMGIDFFHTHPMYRIGKKAAGRLLDGVQHDGYPSPQ